MTDQRNPPRWHIAPQPASVVVEVPRQEMAAEDAERLAYSIIRAVREARLSAKTGAGR